MITMKIKTNKIFIIMLALALGTASIAAGTAMQTAAQPTFTSPVMAVESSNSYYAYSTEDVALMGSIRIAGKQYTLPFTMDQLASDGWEKPQTAQAGQPFVAGREDLQLSLQEDDQGRIVKILELYSSPGALEIPGEHGIKAGISEDELVQAMDQMPLPWESSHFKNGTNKYRVLVPLGENSSTDTTGGANAAALPFPACEFAITVSSRQVKAIEIRMISAPGPDGWPNEVLGFKAAVYYEKNEGETPPLFRIEEQKDGSLLIRLFEDLEDHIATWALYKADRNGKGFDAIMDPNEKSPIRFIN